VRFAIRVWRRLRAGASTLIGRLRLRVEGVTFGEGLVLLGIPIVSRADKSSIVLGRRVVLVSDSWYTALGVNHPVVLRTLGPGAEIVINDDVGISGGAICAARRIAIGPGCLLGANVTIADTDFHPVRPENRRYEDRPSHVPAAPVTIDENVFIGSDVIVLKGVHIGRNSVIGAGSVVTQDVPPDSVAAGIPCRVIGSVRAGSEQGVRSEQKEISGRRNR
jgi:acetyltransferase-like isoleucine patch superfamily enzyme